MNGRVAVVGWARDRHVHGVLDRLVEQRADVVAIDPLDLPSISLGTDATEVRIGRALTRPPRAAYVHHLYGDSLSYAAVRPHEVEPDWRGATHVARRRSELLTMLLTAWEHAGTRLYNAPSAVFNASLGPALAALASAGLPVAATLCTNDVGEAQAFAHPSKMRCDARATCEAPPGTASQLVEPTLVRRRELGTLTRAYVVDGRVVGTHGVTADGAADEGLDAGKELLVLCARATHVLRLRFAAVDIGRAPNRRLELVHVDPTPEYLLAPHGIGDEVQARLADALMRDRFVSSIPPSGEGTDLLRARVDRYEALVIETALSETRGNQVRAAELLGVPLRTLVYKINKYGLRARDVREREG